MVARLVSGWLLLCYFLSFSASATPFEDSTASTRQLLDRMATAAARVNYKGVMIYGSGTRWNTLSIQHSVVNGIEYERLVHLTGAPRDFIRRDQVIYSQHPVEQMSQPVRGLGNPLTLSLALGERQLADFYTFTAMNYDRIAGHIAQRIDVLPKQLDRYGYRLWLDNETGLLLRSDLISDRGEVLERFQFAEVLIGIDLPMENFVPHAKARQIGIHQPFAHQIETSDSLASSNQQWMPAWLPPGFEFAGGHPIVGPLAEQPVMMTFTDGLASLTLFVEHSDKAYTIEVARQKGPTAALVRSIDYANAKAQITLVGELPVRTMERIARSITPVQ